MNGTFRCGHICECCHCCVVASIRALLEKMSPYAKRSDRFVCVCVCVCVCVECPDLNHQTNWGIGWRHFIDGKYHN